RAATLGRRGGDEPGQGPGPRERAGESLQEAHRVELPRPVAEAEDDRAGRDDDEPDEHRGFHACACGNDAAGDAADERAHRVRGWRTGVGMGQWGAEGYARHGYGYRQILAHYYPHTHIGLAGAREVRVLLKQGSPSFRIGSSAPFVVLDARGHKSHLAAKTFL